MAILGGTQFLERLQFFNGQRMFASDLQSLEAFNREMRWLHNQSLHQPGVGNGYGVAGKKGDRHVTITPGYALDACGREIVLTESHIEPVPPVADDGNGASVFYDLTVSYPDDTDLVESETRKGICLPQGAVRLREAPNFCWIQLGANLQPLDPQLKLQVQSSMRIVLARAEIRNCQLYQPLSTAQRRNARQATQPHIACGSTGPGTKPGWRVASVIQSGQTTLFGLAIDVDTSAGRFQTPPCYSAHIVGERVFSSANALGFRKSEMPYLLDGFVDISNPTEKSFTLQLLMPALENDFVNPGAFLSAFSANPEAGNKVLDDNGWLVVWMGVES